MDVLIVAGLALTITMFVIMTRVNLLRFLGYSTIVDVVFTILMFVMFAHTFSGVVAGSFGGMFMALFLSMGRKLLGYERLQFKGRWFRLRYSWEYTAPTWNVPGLSERLMAATRG